VLVRPSSTEELASAVTSLVARAASEGRPLKMRATRDGFASIPSFPCATQPSDPNPFAAYPKPPLVAGLLLQNMNKVLAIDAEKRQMTVQAQMTLKEFYTAATAANLSIPRASLPWWQGLTLAGVMATTSHGTGLNVTSMIVSLGALLRLRVCCFRPHCPQPLKKVPAHTHKLTLTNTHPKHKQTQCDWLVEVTWVDGKGAVHTSPAGSDEARGLCGGIGIVGVISELKLQMTPTSTTHVSTWYVKDDKDIANDINKMLAITPHLVVMWRPDIGKYTGHMQRPASPNATVIKDGACNVIPQFAPLVARMLGPGLRAWQNDYANREVVSYATSGDSFICAAALTNAVGAPWITKPGPLTATLGISQPVLDGVVYTNKAASTDCGDRCAWLTKSFQGTALDVEFAFEKKDLASFIADIKALIAKDLKGVPGMHNNGRCLLPGYYVLRFGRAPESHVGMAAGLSEPVYVQVRAERERGRVFEGGVLGMGGVGRGCKIIDCSCFCSSDQTPTSFLPSTQKHTNAQQQMLASRNTPGVPTRYEWVQETYEQLMLCKYKGRPVRAAGCCEKGQ
jgi:hypothetical protein